MNAIFRFAVMAVLVGVGGSVSLAHEFAWLADQPGRVDGGGAVGCCSTLDRSCGSCRSHTWEVKAGAVYLKRDRLPSRDLAQGLSTETSLNARDFRFDYEVGPDLTVIWHGSAGSLEFRWFQVHDWISHGPTLVDGAAIGMEFREPLLTPEGAELDSRYLSQLRSFELNAKRDFTSRLTGLAGFRFAQLDEWLDLTGETGSETFGVHVKGFNNLYGFQLGGEFGVWDTGGPFRIVAVGKAGIYVNEARNQGVLIVDQEELGVDSASNSRVAFLGELGLIANYRITDFCAVNAGYQVMWLDGVAMASQQASRLNAFPEAEPGASIDMGGTAFYHGVTANVEFRW